MTKNGMPIKYKEKPMTTGTTSLRIDNAEKVDTVCLLTLSTVNKPAVKK